MCGPQDIRGVWIPFRCGSWSYWNGFGWGWLPAAGCRRVGWGFGHGFGSGVYAINIGRLPANYHLPTRPVHIPGMLHPIAVGRASTVPSIDAHPSHESRIIAGVPVEPLRSIGNPAPQKDRSVVGSALRSDFAVDRVSRQPVFGAAGAAPSTTLRSDLRPAPLRSSVTSAADNGNERPAYSLPPAQPTQPQRSYYPAQPHVEPSAPRPAAPMYAPRSAPPPSQPQAPRSAPSAPTPSAPTTAAPKR